MKFFRALVRDITGNVQSVDLAGYFEDSITGEQVALRMFPPGPNTFIGLVVTIGDTAFYARNIISVKFEERPCIAED